MLFPNYDIEYSAVEGIPEIGTTVKLVGCGEDSWYDWEPNGPYDLVWIDALQGEGKQDDVLRVLERLRRNCQVRALDRQLLRGAFAEVGLDGRPCISHTPGRSSCEPTSQARVELTMNWLSTC